jgi:hypothetical protein
VKKNNSPGHTVITDRVQVIKMVEINEIDEGSSVVRGVGSGERVRNMVE